MPLPAGIDTCEITLTVPLDALGRLATSLTGAVKPDRYLVWEATGEPILPVAAKLPAPDGGEITMTLPTTNQPGIVDSEGNAVTDWSYSIHYTATFANRRKASYTKPFQIDQALTELDLDSVPFGNVVSPAVTAPTAVVTSAAGLTGVVSAAALAGALDSLLVGKYTRIDVVADHGADNTGATSAVTAVNAAIAAANATTGGVELYFPPGTYNLTAGGLTPITASSVYVIGAGRRVTTIKFQSNTLFKWDSSANGGGCSDLRFACNTSAPDTSSLLLEVVTGSRQWFERLFIDNAYKIFRGGFGTVLGCTQITFSDVYGYTHNSNGSIAFDFVSGAVLTMRDCVVFANCSFPTNATDLHPANTTTGIRFGQGKWDTFVLRNVDLNRYNIDLDFSPTGSGTNVSNGWITDCVFDYAKTNAVRFFPATLGDLRSIYIKGCWGVASDGHSWLIDGTNGVVKHVHFTNCVGRQSGQNNWRFLGTLMEGIELLNCHGLGANRLAGTNTGSTQDDLVILGSGVSVRGGWFGEDGAPYVGFTNQARYGVNVSPDLTSCAVVDVAADGATGAYILNANTAGSRRRRVNGNRRRSSSSAPEYATTSTVSTAGISGVTQTHVGATLDTLYIFGGTVANIVHNGIQVGSTGPATLTLRPGDTWQVVFTVAPTIIRAVAP